MTGDFIGWIVAIIVGIFGLGGVYLKGRNDGKSKEKSKQAEHDAAAKRQHDAIVDKAKDVERDVNQLPVSDVDKQLRDKYTRD